MVLHEESLLIRNSAHPARRSISLEEAGELCSETEGLGWFCQGGGKNHVVCGRIIRHFTSGEKSRVPLKVTRKLTNIARNFCAFMHIT